MDGSESRQVARDSLFLIADLRLEGALADHRIKVRNLSEGGMMGEGDVRVARGVVVEVNLRNIGWVRGSVAWVHETRFGVAFAEPIDPHLARVKPDSAGETAPRFTRSPETFRRPGLVRKV